MIADAWTLLVPVATVAVAYGGVKAGLNGTKDNIRTLTRVIERQSEKIDLHSEKITKLETETINIKHRLDKKFLGE